MRTSVLPSCVNGRTVDETPFGTFNGGDEIPPGTFHGVYSL